MSVSHFRNNKESITKVFIIMWLLFSVVLVFIIQAGFLCLESGSTRSKNNINVAAKNIIDFVLSAALFWLLGFGLMFGDTLGGVVGSSHFFFGENMSGDAFAFFLFQMMFCGTAATLTSGAAAERMRFWGYIYITIILSTLIYPIIGHWTWGGLFTSGNQGWLESLGFVDFAGATVVHSVGGWFALATIIILGPRIGRFAKDKRFPSGSNLPMAALGVFLIWLGWFGFNGGSTLKLNDQVPGILLNTCLSAVWGAVAVTAVHYLHKKYIDVSYSLNGIIAGLVGITAACHAVSPKEAALIGLISGFLMYQGSLYLERLKIDDALSVVPAHLIAGIWGTLAVALFGDPEILGTGLSASSQLLVQCIGILVVGLYSFGISYPLILIINRYFPIRVSPKHEVLGLNITEHNAKTELIDLLGEMETQQQQGNFTSRVQEEAFTEVGQIAHKYNQVIARVQSEMHKRDSALEQFKNSEKRKSAILNSSMDCVISIDSKGIIIEFNRAAEKTLGNLKKHVIGQSFIDCFVCDEDIEAVKTSLEHGFSSGEGLILNRRKNFRLKRLSGDSFPAEITITSTFLDSHFHTEYTLHIRDIAQDLKLQSRLKFLAYKDPLTGLSNRTHMMKGLSSFIDAAATQSMSVALFFLDLDKFKKINDTLGHKAGDQLLCEVANRLKSISRDTDIIARWGGDEFIYVILGKLNRNVINEKSNAILEQLRRPIEINQKDYKIPTSIGISISPNGTVKADKLIQNADIAMYHAKMNGRDNCQFFTKEMGESAAKTLTFEHEIKKAIDLRQFYLVYQPKVFQQKGQIYGAEALVRWLHPEKGEIFPSSFIPIAEESELIVEIGELVINMALKQLRFLLDSGVPPVPISVNISGKQLLSKDFTEFLEHQLILHDVPGTLLEIEITEHVLIRDIEQCIQALQQIKSLGVTISIDDFGTGYSSLNYLKRLPLDILKIDRSFVSECATVDEDKEICAAIINLAKGMNLKTVAEGVESVEQKYTLLTLGCDCFQGYYFYKPMSDIELTNLLEENRQDKRVTAIR